jgi:DNA-binding transcriptional LysR family regulator
MPASKSFAKAARHLGVSRSTVAHDVGERAVGDDLECDRGMRGKKFSDNRLDHHSGSGPGHGEAQVSRRLVAEDVDRFDRLVEALERWAQLSQQAFADLGRRDAALSDSGVRAVALASTLIRGWRDLPDA